MSEKREFRISSEDAARPAATIHDEPRYFAQGLKPQQRHVVETHEGVLVDNGFGEEVCVVRNVYNDGMISDTQVSREAYPNAKKLVVKATKASTKE